MKYTWIALCQRSSPIHTLFLHVSTLACCTVGVAAGLKDSQLHSGGPREGGQLYWLLQRGGQTIPHIRGWWPSGQNLGLSGIEMNQREQVTVCFKHFIHEQPGKLYWSLLFRSDTKDFLVLYLIIPALVHISSPYCSLLSATTDVLSRWTLFYSLLKILTKPMVDIFLSACFLPY